MFSRAQAWSREGAAVRSFVALLALCAGCSAGGGDDEAAAPPQPRGFATQIRAPAPDYRALLEQPSLAAEGRRRRGATSPPPPDAKAIGELWIARLEKRGALLGYGLGGKGADGPARLIDTGLTEEEFVRWAAENGWRVPDHIDWGFVPELALPAVSEAAARGIRIWPASRARTGLQHLALFHGRIELRDGCFLVGLFDQPADKLAWFHAEVGLDVDSSGYFILRERVGGQVLARLGEDMNWGGPATAHIDEETERALRDACGAGEILIVGTPEASERFLAQYPHLRHPRPPPPPPPPRKD